MKLALKIFIWLLAIIGLLVVAAGAWLYYFVSNSDNEAEFQERQKAFTCDDYAKAYLMTADPKAGVEAMGNDLEHLSMGEAMKAGRYLANDLGIFTMLNHDVFMDTMERMGGMHKPADPQALEVRLLQVKGYCQQHPQALIAKYIGDRSHYPESPEIYKDFDAITPVSDTTAPKLVDDFMKMMKMMQATQPKDQPAQ